MVLVRHQLPKASAGQAIGLLGGSFDPAHRGHVHITEAALTRFGLDRVWWLVSPGNPLKARGPAPLARRMEHANALIGRSPHVVVTDVEARLGTRFTADTIAALRSLYPGVGFVWLMGADNLAEFHRWQDWRQIMASVPVGVIARPGERRAARLSVAARIYRQARLSGRASHLLPHLTPPAWCLINIPMMAHSSSAIRAGGGW